MVTPEQRPVEPKVPQTGREGRFALTEFDDAGTVGSGSYGQVRKVIHRRTGVAYAMKVIPKQLVLQHNMGEYLEREARTQARLHHPNILRLHDRFEDGENIQLLLEFAAGGSLFWALRKCGHYSEEVACPIFAQSSSALDYLHRHGVVHRDVKPENILLCEGNTAKLADFGWCAELSRGSLRKTFCGTFDYLSPEMIHDEPHDFAVDIWAMGVLLYELLVGRPPFMAKNQAECVAKISRVDFEIPDAVPSLAADVIKRLLTRKPEDRLPLASALTHPWVRIHGGSLLQTAGAGLVAAPAALQAEHPTGTPAKRQDSGPFACLGFAPPGSGMPSAVPSQTDSSTTRPGSLTPPTPRHNEYDGSSDRYPWRADDRASVLRSLDLQGEDPNRPIRPPDQKLGALETSWKATGTFKAVRTFVRKGTADLSLARDLDTTIMDPLTGRLRKASAHGWADGREISPVRYSGNASPNKPRGELLAALTPRGGDTAWGSRRPSECRA